MIEAGRGATGLVPASPSAPLRRGEDRALQNIIAMYVNAITSKASRLLGRHIYTQTGRKTQTGHLGPGFALSTSPVAGQDSAPGALRRNSCICYC